MINKTSSAFKRVGAFLVDIILAILIAVGVNFVLMKPLFDSAFKMPAKLALQEEKFLEIDSYYEQYDIATYVIADIRGQGEETFPALHYQFFNIDSLYNADVNTSYTTLIADADVKAVVDGFFERGAGYFTSDGKLAEGVTSFYDLTKREDFKTFLASEIADFKTLKIKDDKTFVDFALESKFLIKPKYMRESAEVRSEYYLSPFLVMSDAELQETTEFKALAEDEGFLQVRGDYNKVSSELAAMQLVMIGFDLLIAEFIVFLLLALIIKQPVTPGKLLFRMKVIGKDDVKVTYPQIIIRFIGIFLFETYSVVIIFSIIPSQLFLALLGPFISLTTMCFTKNQQSLHDLLAKTKVVDLKNLQEFNSVQERDQYLEDMTAQLQESREPRRSPELLEELNNQYQRKSVNRTNEKEVISEPLIENSEEETREEDDQSK
ncbi:MAG: RDD family protein [Bacillales bacterium]|jgi:uncharacterized RDD family membrane protein YckC|nr:RDD family protein [Bacillales bacterium]